MNRRRAIAALATGATLAAMEAVDMAAANAEGDEVRDEGTVQLFSAALGAAMLSTTATLRRRRGRPLFWPGLAMVWSGIAVNRWARLTLARHYRPVVTVTKDHELVDTGPFAYVRHPMYSGGTLICIGIGLATSNPAWLLPPATLVRRIQVEERVLLEALGERYRAYCEGRSRVIPGVW